MHDEETTKPIAEMDKQELLENLFGGLFSLLAEEEYEEIAEVVFALGLKRFLDERVAALPEDEIRAMFEDGEKVIEGILAFATDEGLCEAETDEGD
jgi:hypothetical protein